MFRSRGLKLSCGELPSIKHVISRRKKKRNVTNEDNFRKSHTYRLVADDPTHVEIKDQVQQLLNELPFRDREVIVLRHFEGRTFAEIAELLGVPNGTISSRMARALKRMKNSLAEKRNS